jgi:trehalose 6-phosphate phosphatase
MTSELRDAFGAEGRLALAAALKAQPLLAFDFDGTLAPIVARPDDARVDREVSTQLSRLVQLRPLAIVTGRSIVDVTQRLGFAPTYVVGNHGAEDAGQALRCDASALAPLRRRLAAQSDELRAAGIQVEDKRLSLAIHYRLAPDPRAAVDRIESLMEGLEPALRSFPGKCVVNIVLAAAPDKCDAVESLVLRAGCACAVFLGDDVNDEAVFSRAKPNWLTVRVGRDNPRSQAGFFLGSHSEVTKLLAQMLKLLEAG